MKTDKYEDFDKAMSKKIMNELNGEAVYVNCAECNGLGRLHGVDCENCNGKGDYLLEY